MTERTADLQRLQAEYVNYKKRVDRDRSVARDQGISHVLVNGTTLFVDGGFAVSG